MVEKSAALPVAKLFEYFDQLDAIPSEVIQQYLQREAKIQSKRSTIAESLGREKPAFSFKPEFTDKATHNGVDYEFPKWYGIDYDHGNKVKFIKDNRSKQTTWAMQMCSTKNELPKLFAQLSKEGLIRSVAS